MNLRNVSAYEWSLTSAAEASDPTRSSPCICVSFIKQVNPPWHLVGESLNKNTTEEESVKPVTLTYLTAVCELNSVSLRSLVSFFLTVSLSSFSLILHFVFCCIVWNRTELKWQKKHRTVKSITVKDKVEFHFEYRLISWVWLNTIALILLAKEVN